VKANAQFKRKKQTNMLFMQFVAKTICKI